DATLSVTLHNAAGATGPPYVIGNHVGLPLGTNYQQLAVYTPLRLADVTARGRPVDRGAGTEYGRFVYYVLVAVPPSSDLTVTFSLEGEIARNKDYNLLVIPQPLANPDHLHVEAAGVKGWLTKGTRSADVSAEAENFSFHVGLRRK